MDRGWDVWMASLTRWTWVWVNSEHWWWTGRPGMLQFMGSQRGGHDWVTELNWTVLDITSNTTLNRSGKNSYFSYIFQSFLLQKFFSLSPLSIILTTGFSYMSFIMLGDLEIWLQCRRPQFDSWVRKIRWRRDRLPTPVFLGFPCGSAGKESACNAGDLGLIPGLGRSPGEGNGYPLQCSGLENSMGRPVHGITELDTTKQLTLYLLLLTLKAYRNAQNSKCF